MDVVRSNFEDVFPQIEQDLKQCDFVAIDAEFTGLTTNSNQRPSLFDNPSDRYKKLKRTVQEFLVCQFGISAFVKSNENSNTYEAHTYNFHLFPTSFGQIDARFLCQASSLEFLSIHKHDFNKFVYEGIPFLNSSQKAELEEICLNNHVEVPLGLNREIEKNIILPECKKIEKWLHEQGNDDLVLQCSGAFLQFILYQEIRKKFSNLRCKVQMQGQLIVQHSEEKTSQDDKEQIEKIVRQSCGFTRVFELLVTIKKPLLGHNLLTDLHFMYEKFNKPLPDDYNTFKKEIHQLFPYIFDTKHVAFSLNKHKFFKETDIFRKTNLEELYSELSCHKGLYYVLYTPVIIHSKNCNKYSDTKKIHEAGYDAYISGYVFLRMAHILAAKSMGSTMDRALDFHQYFDIIQSLANCVNIIRSTVPYVNFAGNDPESTRPDWLLISGKRNLKKITSGQILHELEKFGSLDVKVLDNQKALIATVHSRVSQQIVNALSHHKTLKVRKYYPLLDSPRSRTLIWAGGITTMVTFLFSAVYYGRRKLLSHT